MRFGALEKDITLDDGRDSYMLAAQVGAAAALLMMTKNFKLRQDKARLNALDYAVNSGHLDCVNIILSSQRISNIELKYAINVASENRFLEIERALVSFKIMHAAHLTYTHLFHLNTVRPQLNLRPKPLFMPLSHLRVPCGLLSKTL